MKLSRQQKREMFRRLNDPSKQKQIVSSMNREREKQIMLSATGKMKTRARIAFISAIVLVTILVTLALL